MGRVQLLRGREREGTSVKGFCVPTHAQRRAQRRAHERAFVFVATRSKIVQRTDAPPKSEDGLSSEVNRPEFIHAVTFLYIYQTTRWNLCGIDMLAWVAGYEKNILYIPVYIISAIPHWNVSPDQFLNNKYFPNKASGRSVCSSAFLGVLTYAHCQARAAVCGMGVGDALPWQRGKKTFKRQTSCEDSHLCRYY
jgi:hypothetical protein